MTLIERVFEAMTGDDSDDSERLERLYLDADAAGRQLLDDAFICVCGWSLKTLLDGHER
jgi:hypothetical protein